MEESRAEEIVDPKTPLILYLKTLIEQVARLEVAVYEAPHVKYQKDRKPNPILFKRKDKQVKKPKREMSFKNANRASKMKWAAAFLGQVDLNIK